MRLLMSFFVLTSIVAFAADTPTISADLGPCSARFNVTDGTKPLYDAKVRTRIRYGAFGVRKLDLEIGTDVNGKAAVIKLPDIAKRQIVFEIVKDDISRSVIFDPAEKCDAVYEVALRKSQAATPENPQP